MLHATFGSLFECQCHSMTFQHNCARPITSLFEVLFKNFSHKWSSCWDDVPCTILVATLKVKVTAWPCSKVVSGSKLCYLKSDFTTSFGKLLLCVQYLFGEHYQVPTVMLWFRWVPYRQTLLVPTRDYGLLDDLMLRSNCRNCPTLLDYYHEKI